MESAAVTTARERKLTLPDELERHDDMVAGLRARANNLRSQIDDNAERQRQHAAAVVATRVPVWVCLATDSVN